MLSITSILLLLIQFGLDAYTISHGTTMQFLDILDVFWILPFWNIRNDTFGYQ